MKRLGHVLISMFLFGSPLLAERVVKVEALSTDTTTFRQNRIQLGMVELAAQLLPYQSAPDLSAYALLAGDADGQTIQGRTGENQARIEIAVGSNSEVVLRGVGLSHGTVFADNEGAYLYSADSGSYIYSIDSEGTVIASSLAIRLISGQTPPTNANDTCTAGDTIDTATFHYYCHATDSWVRAPMASW